ncbi:MAG: phosphoglucomutase/phosphomannomutase family protein [Anaerolineae bacterium]|nr:phosphoglucomutase/phosphomannomutase family protein [Anaerolineae bacterium]
MSIRFGTDGWRAVIAEDFTFANVRLAAQATANYVNAELRGEAQPSVVVGFDTRFLSDRFAMAVATVLAANDLHVFLTRADAPTPAVSYNVLAQGAAAGIMITASHNPPRYNGFKLKSRQGCAMSKAETERVEHHLAALLKSGETARDMDYDQALAEGRIERFEPAWTYFEHLNQLLDMDKVSLSEARVVADAMFGSGRNTFPSILSRTRCTVTEIRGYMNPGFEAIHPEPIEKYLKMLMATIKAQHADIGIATDGDADRIGAMDGEGRFVDPHTIMALALRYLVEERGLCGSVVKTVSTTAMLNRIAKKHGLELHETPVGFSYIADLMLAGGVLIGGEESGGISISGHIPEGDGILMGLLLLEIMGAHQAPLAELVDDLQKNFGPTVYQRVDLHLKQPVPKSEMVQRLAENAPAQMAGQAVRDVLTADGAKFILADESWLLVRPSGTEPVLRVYAEGTSEAEVAAILAVGQELAALAN